MTFTPERSSVNQRVQIGAESTIGTAVPAGKLLECFDWVFGINGDVVDYTPTGHKYVNVQEENTEWTDITLGGEMDYNGLIYPAGGVFGAVTPAAHGSSSVAKDWIYTPPVFGSVAPQTYTLQQGDSTRAHQTAWPYPSGEDCTQKRTRRSNSDNRSTCCSAHSTFRNDDRSVAAYASK